MEVHQDQKVFLEENQLLMRFQEVDIQSRTEHQCFQMQATRMTDPEEANRPVDHSRNHQSMKQLQNVSYRLPFDA